MGSRHSVPGTMGAATGMSGSCSTGANLSLAQASSLQLMKDEYKERIALKGASQNNNNSKAGAKPDSSFSKLRVKDQLFEIDTNSSQGFDHRQLRKKAMTPQIK